MPTYKNLSDQKLTIPGVGEVEPGKTIDSEKTLNNVNLEEIGQTQTPATPAQPTQPKPATPQPTPKIGGSQ